MDRSDVITLIGVTKVQDEYGVWRSERTSRDVFARVSSVSAQEFYEGDRSGLNPQFRMKMFFADYQDEPIVEYKGKTYSIYRTYQAETDTIELYVERKGGSNGKQTSQS